MEAASPSDLDRCSQIRRQTRLQKFNLNIVEDRPGAAARSETPTSAEPNKHLDVDGQTRTQADLHGTPGGT